MTTIMGGFRTVIATGFLLAVSAPLATPSLADCRGAPDEIHTRHVKAAVPTDCDGAVIDSISAVTPASIEEQWGVKILGVRLSAANYILDFRFQVTDPEKAAPLLDRQFAPRLIDEATGAIMRVPQPPKIGSLRQNTGFPKAGRNYFVLFSNPAKYVKQGQKISVVIGDFKVENLVVGG